MKTVSIIGHFWFGKESFSGQIIKTKIVAREITKWFTAQQVCLHDTHGGIFFLLRSPFVVLMQLMEAAKIIMMPGENGIKIITPLLAFFNIFFKRKLYYVVIGGWLPVFVSSHKSIAKMLKRFNGLYVETERLKSLMEEQGFSNVFVMPNAKSLPMVNEKEIDEYDASSPFSFCIFSRIIESKGIKDAINAIELCNKKYGKQVASLDIYGEIEEHEWFDELKQHFPNYIRYCGKVPFEESVGTIRKYYALLFPTYYEGECFPGTLIDAMAAGVPVIASDWHDNASIVVDGKTGLIYETRNVEQLAESISRLINSKEMNIKMRKEALKQAKSYLPENAFLILRKELFS